MNRYLVTGAAGFIGANVAQALLDAGCEVVGFEPSTDLATGLERFVAWYCDYYQV